MLRSDGEGGSVRNMTMWIGLYCSWRLASQLGAWYVFAYKKRGEKLTGSDHDVNVLLLYMYE